MNNRSVCETNHYAKPLTNEARQKTNWLASSLKHKPQNHSHSATPEVRLTHWLIRCAAFLKTKPDSTSKEKPKNDWLRANITFLPSHGGGARPLFAKKRLPIHYRYVWHAWTFDKRSQLICLLIEQMQNVHSMTMMRQLQQLVRRPSLPTEQVQSQSKHYETTCCHLKIPAVPMRQHRLELRNLIFLGVEICWSLRNCAAFMLDSAARFEQSVKRSFCWFWYFWTSRLYLESNWTMSTWVWVPRIAFQISMWWSAQNIPLITENSLSASCLLNQQNLFNICPQSIANIFKHAFTWN